MKLRHQSRFTPRRVLDMPLHSIRTIVCAMVEVAVDDYRHFVTSGLIADGKVNQAYVSKRTGNNTFSHADASRLLHFFQPGGIMEEWLELAGVDISGSQIRARLGIGAKEAA